MNRLIVSLHILSILESSINPGAINYKTQAYGLYQITQPALSDYNNTYGTNWRLKDMLVPSFAYDVADWYVNQAIPQMIRVSKVSDTLEHRLIAYNWGIGNLRKWVREGEHYEKLPKETREYVRKYRELDEARDYSATTVLQ